MRLDDGPTASPGVLTGRGGSAYISLPATMRSVGNGLIWRPLRSLETGSRLGLLGNRESGLVRFHSFGALRPALFDIVEEERETWTAGSLRAGLSGLAG